jgi:hypothetical protein
MGNRNMGDGRTERLAMASFAATLSPLAWSFVYFLPPVAIAVAVSGPVLALILGYQARRTIKLSQGGLRGALCCAPLSSLGGSRLLSTCWRRLSSYSF